MKIIPIHTHNMLAQSLSSTQTRVLGEHSAVVSFKSSSKKEPNKFYLSTTRLLNKITNKPLYQCDLEKLEGVQNGLKSFEGLSLKQIAFALTNLLSINMLSGCTRHCVHCYANSQPEIKRYPFEDLKQFCDDVKELRKRTGAQAVYHHGSPHTDISFDADGLNCHLFDKDGNKHDYVEIAKLIKTSTGYPPVFDTNGWEAQDTEKQKIAEDYVKKLLKDDNYKNFYQINVSINPFNPVYVRAVKSGYPLKDLYSPVVRIDAESLEREEKLSPAFKKMRNEYTKYIKDTANVLVTFKPLLKTENFGLIIRVLDNNITQMKGFRQEDFKTTLAHILTQLKYRQVFWGDLTKDEFNKYHKLLSCHSVNMFTSGRMEKFYKVQNKGSLEGIENIDPERVMSYQQTGKIKAYKSVKKSCKHYLKMIAPDGKAYMYDNYSIIPTDIQFKTSIKNIEKPFNIKLADFTVTEDMMDMV